MKIAPGMKVFAAEPIENLEYTLDPLKESGCELIIGPPVAKPNEGYSESRLIKMCADQDAFIGMAREKMTEAVINAAERMRVICKYGNGVDNIDVKAATKKGVLVANAPVHDMTVAEFTFSLILSVLKKLPRNINHLLGGGWRDASTVGNEIYKKKVGIVGFGGIG